MLQSLNIGVGTRQGPIGIDVGHSSVRLVQLSNKAGRLSLQAVAHEPIALEPGADPHQHREVLGDAIKRALSAGFVGSRAVSCLPTALVNFKNLRLPRMPHDELASAVEWEAAERLHQPGTNWEVQFYNAGEVRQGEELRQEVILLAASQEHVQAHCDALIDAGLEPIAIEAAPAPLARIVTQGDGHAALDQTYLVLDVGYCLSKVLIVRGDKVLFFKTIDVAGQRFDSDVAQYLDMTIADAQALRRGGSAHGEEHDDPTTKRAVDEAMRSAVEELTRELGLCLRYFGVTFRGQRPESVIVTGGESANEYLIDQIARQSGLSVQTCDSQVQLCDPRGAITNQHGPLGAWASAMGLALRFDAEVSRKRGAA